MATLRDLEQERGDSPWGAVFGVAIVSSVAYWWHGTQIVAWLSGFVSCLFLCIVAWLLSKLWQEYKWIRYDKNSHRH